MYAITGITGNVGSELARTLLAAGQRVRGIVRDAKKGEEWAARGCSIALATMEDTAALTSAFEGATGVFILAPPDFDPEPGYRRARQVIDTIEKAVRAGQPGKVVCLSTIGADAASENLLSPRTWLEASLRALPMPLTLLRPAWFLENAAWDVTSALQTGLIHSFLQPLDKAFPMVSAKDVGRTAANLIQEDWTGERVVELEGPRRVSPNDLAGAFARALRSPVRATAVPRESWEGLFREQGMKNPMPRMRMLDGFNEGWIEFQDRGTKAVKGQTSIDAVVAALVSRANA
jgi:NAD(P)H dehydrogenase (quinone)